MGPLRPHPPAPVGSRRTAPRRTRVCAAAALAAAAAALAFAGPARAGDDEEELFGCMIQTGHVVNEDGSTTRSERDCSTDPTNPDYPNDPQWPLNPDDPSAPGNPYPASRYLPKTTEWYINGEKQGTGRDFTYTLTGPGSFGYKTVGTRYDGREMVLEGWGFVPSPADARKDMTWSVPASLTLPGATFYVTTAKTHVLANVMTGQGEQAKGDEWPVTQVSATPQPDGRTTYGFELPVFSMTATPQPVTVFFEAWTDDREYFAEGHAALSTVTSADYLSAGGYGGPQPVIRRTGTRLLVTPYWNIRAFSPYTGHVTERVRAWSRHRWVRVTQFELPFGPRDPDPSAAAAGQPTATQRSAVVLPRKYRKRPLELRLTWLAETPDRSDQLRVSRTYWPGPASAGRR